MPLVTLDRSPPPFFKQGPSAFTRLMFFSALAIFLMVADARWKVTQPLRAVVATMLQPVQSMLLAPQAWWADASHYTAGLEAARLDQHQAQKKSAAQAERAMRVDQLERENARLRELLALRPRVNVQSQAAEVLYDAPDPFTRKVVIDQGSHHGVILGSPVIDELGVLGQVTRVYPLTSEVTLVTDKDAAVPVVNSRTRQRGVAYGTPQVLGMELRFMAGNADVQMGDELQTSGLDGIYPAGLPVAKVARVDRRADSAFARIVLTPKAQPDNSRHVLLLHPVSDQLPDRPSEAETIAASASAPAPAASTQHHAKAESAVHAARQPSTAHPAASGAKP
ncbi:rod shape-determining protein MreC [Aquabacterium sp.]|uniref:rod shape-determining protein MreC n=1 Tax=Aquabacterium sp. TaxID=1872578 RepID=UPI00198FA8B5|nr:rod shape-determining protein MreC [Aquabacterium sp.]MBC7700301.1 rod shape-determining protein MreC [Aquabacterium sp.]